MRNISKVILLDLKFLTPEQRRKLKLVGSTTNISKIIGPYVITEKDSFWLLETDYAKEPEE